MAIIGFDCNTKKKTLSELLIRQEIETYKIAPYTETNIFSQREEF